MTVPVPRTPSPADMPPTTLGPLPALNAAMLALLENAVLRARLNGSSWATIGRSLGVSRQAAHKRWRHLDEEAGGTVLLVVDETDKGRRPHFVSTVLGERLDPTLAGRQESLRILEGAVVRTASLLGVEPAALA